MCARSCFPTAKLTGGSPHPIHPHPMLLPLHQSNKREMASFFFIWISLITGEMQHSFSEFIGESYFHFHEHPLLLLFLNQVTVNNPFGSLPKSNSRRFPFSLVFSFPAKYKQDCVSLLAPRKSWFVSSRASSTISRYLPRAEKTK